MRKNTEFGYMYKRLQHLERMLGYADDNYKRLLGQMTTLFQRIAKLENPVQEDSAADSKKSK